MKESILIIHPISGAEITHSEETGKTTVTIGVQSIEAAEDMFYAMASTCKTSLHIKRHRILGLCLRAMIFKD